METTRRSLVWYLLAGTRGGPNRIRILEELQLNPHNAHQLAEVLGLDYRTIRHHLKLLERNGLIRRPVGDAYASPYELAPEIMADFEVVLDAGRRGRSVRERSAHGSRLQLGKVRG